MQCGWISSNQLMTDDNNYVLSFSPARLVILG